MHKRQVVPIQVGIRRREVQGELGSQSRSDEDKKALCILAVFPIVHLVGIHCKNAIGQKLVSAEVYNIKTLSASEPNHRVKAMSVCPLNPLRVGSLLKDTYKELRCFVSAENVFYMIMFEVQCVMINSTKVYFLKKCSFSHYFFDSSLSSEKKIIKTSFSVERNQNKFHYF